MNTQSIDKLGDKRDKQKLAKAKLFFAALLSIGDMLTDIMMIVQYFRTRSMWGYAWASLGSLFTNLTLQALLSFTQNRAKPWKRQLREQFYVWSLVKPGVDAWRVASGAAQERGQMVNAQYELTANKSTELVAEAIPGTLIQLSALLMSESKPTRRALFSFAFCILTAAFTSAITSWDWDLDKENRKKQRQFYGYIPSNVKGLTVVMGVVAALQYEKVVYDVISSPNSTFVEDVELGEDNQQLGGEKSRLEESTVVTIMVLACAGMVVSYASLLVSVKREYLHTFISTKTSRKSSQESFTKNEEDEVRFRIFSSNRHKWEHKIGAEVKVWINERLPLWLEEPPEWFNDHKRSVIPDDFVTDPKILVRLRTNNVKRIIEKRRRSSVGDIFATQMTEETEEEESSVKA
ncbi:hypothetical protein TrCOL_g13532 [Triparma columacea]|uniref:Uncharacterized protein n=1 Tax=Triparma columacea TaxID=722753 RepID=A0A9W7GEC0_9STRA|nr:hypothetical protein TrCOL_g13532 [Triparma columacea]